MVDISYSNLCLSKKFVMLVHRRNHIHKLLKEHTANKGKLILKMVFVVSGDKCKLWNIRQQNNPMNVSLHAYT